jgi:hypothetical protein
MDRIFGLYSLRRGSPLPEEIIHYIIRFIPVDLVNYLIKAYPHMKWDYSKLSESRMLTALTIMANPDFPWDKEALMSNPKIGRDINEPWSSELFTTNPKITWDFVKSSGFQFSYAWLESKKWERIIENPDGEWDFAELSKDDNIPFEVVMNYPDKPWDFRELSKNICLPWKLVKANTDKPWKYESILKNHYILWKIMKEIFNLGAKNWLVAYPKISWCLIKINLIRNYYRLLNMSCIKHAEKSRITSIIYDTEH